jgi:hypothetical protein
MESNSSLRWGSRWNETSQRARGIPIWLCLAIIGCATWLYLAQAGRVSADTAALQRQQHAEQQMQSRYQEALEQLGKEQSPISITQRAQALGMHAGNWGDRP